MKKTKILHIFLTCLKVIIPVLLIVPLVFFSYRLVEGRLDDIKNAGNEDYHSGTGFYIFASHALLIAADVIAFAAGGVGLLISSLSKTDPMREKNISHFKSLLIAPMLNHLLYLLITVIAVNLIK